MKGTTGKVDIASATPRARRRRGGRLSRMLAVLILALSWIGPARAAGDVVILSTLEWPPFVSSYLGDFGATGGVVANAFARQGYEVRFVFNPWPVSVEMARTGQDGVVAYFPGYHCRHRENFLASDPIGSSRLGLAERVDAPIHWQSLDDLGAQGLKIGTVLGYTNTEEFDRRVGMGWIRAIPSGNDAENLVRLLRGRIDAAVVDKRVFEYLIATERALAAGRDELRFNARPIGDASFHLCFRGDEQGVRLRNVFNLGLESVDVAGYVEGYLESLPEVREPVLDEELLRKK